MSGKVRQLADALADNVRNGDSVFLGGFGHAVPFAAGRELIRQGRSGLTLCKSGADILFDQMIAAGAVSKIVFGWIGNPGIGASHALRRALARGDVELEEWTNFSMMLRFLAAVLGVPFLPTRILSAGDVPKASAQVAAIRCPFSGDALQAVPALAPDVAIVHAQRADSSGNVQMWGIIGDTVEGALASSRIVATVEEVVPEEVVRRDPNRTLLPGYRVDAVCHVPWGAHPSYVQGYYTRDDDAYADYDRVSRSEESLDRYLKEWIHRLAGHADYAARLDQRRLAAADVPSAPVSYGLAPS